MYYGELKKRDIANGRGVRVSLFVSGCTRHCPGCFNSETWNFHYGKPFTEETVQEVIEALAPSFRQSLCYPILMCWWMENLFRPGKISVYSFVVRKTSESSVCRNL